MPSGLFSFYGSPGADVIQLPPDRMPRTGSRAVTLPASATSVPVEPRNAHVWRQVAEFLDDQWLASLGWFRVSSAKQERTAGQGGPACGGLLPEGRDVLRLAV